MSGFELWKFLHVLFAIAWLGGGFGIFVLQGRLRKAEDRVGLMAVGRQMDGFAKTYYSPASAGALITGIAAVAASDGYSYTDTWILIGFIGIAVTLGIGFGLIAPAGRQLVAEADKTPPDPGVMAALSGRLRTLTLINLTVLVVVVWAMVTKPGY